MSMRMDTDSPQRDTENLTILGPLVTCTEGGDDLRADSDSTVSHDDQHDDDNIDVDDAITQMARLSSSCGKRGPDQEKKMRREIANSNERRRMQSINAGFQSLRALLPKRDGEKISKAAILQQTAEYVQKLELEKAELADLNIKYKTLVEKNKKEHTKLVTPISDDSKSLNYHDIPPKKRKRFEIIGESQDECFSVINDVKCNEPLLGRAQSMEQMGDLRRSLEQERRVRLLLEDQLRSMELRSRLQTLGGLLPSSDYVSYGDPYLPNGVLTPLLPRTTSGFGPPCTLPFTPLPVDSCTRLPPLTAASMNGKSLEVMLEAIRHLEGEIEPESSVAVSLAQFYRPMAIRADIQHQSDSGISSPVSDKSRYTA